MTNVMVPCNYCNVTGKIASGYDGCATTMCPVCLGRRQISIDSNAKKCMGCNSTGKQTTGYYTQGLVRHSSCHGTGWIVQDKAQAAFLVAYRNKMR